MCEEGKNTEQLAITDDLLSRYRYTVTARSFK